MSLTSILVRNDLSPSHVSDAGLWRVHLAGAAVVERSVPFLVGYYSGLRALPHDPRARIHYRFRLLFFLTFEPEPWLSIDLDGQGDAFFLGGHDRTGHFSAGPMSGHADYQAFRTAALALAVRSLVADPSARLDVQVLLEEARQRRELTCAPVDPPGIEVPADEQIVQACPLCTSVALWSHGDGRSCPVCDGRRSVNLRRVPCGVCWTEGAVKCRACSGFASCDACRGSCIARAPGGADLRLSWTICPTCFGSGKCGQCAGLGTDPCPACWGARGGDPRLLWWNAFTAAVRSGSVDDLTLAHRLFFPLMLKADRGPVLAYALEELRRQTFPRDTLARLERYSGLLVPT